MGKETGGCPGNGWLAAAELCPPFLLPKKHSNTDAVCGTCLSVILVEGPKTDTRIGGAASLVQSTEGQHCPVSAGHTIADVWDLKGGEESVVPHIRCVQLIFKGPHCKRLPD